VKYFIIESISFQEKIERQEKSMREMYIEEITKNLNVLSEHFLKCVWIFTSNLASEKKGGAR
jgi:hypothetical protein